MVVSFHDFHSTVVLTLDTSSGSSWDCCGSAGVKPAIIPPTTDISVPPNTWNPLWENTSSRGVRKEPQ